MTRSPESATRPLCALASESESVSLAGVFGLESLSAAAEAAATGESDRSNTETPPPPPLRIRTSVAAATPAWSIASDDRASLADPFACGGLPGAGAQASGR